MQFALGAPRCRRRPRRLRCGTGSLFTEVEAAKANLGLLEERVFRVPKEHSTKVPDPFSDNAERLFAYRKEPGGDGLPTLSRDSPSILEDMALLKIDMLEL